MENDYTNRKYTLVPYDPAWKARFSEIAETVRSVFGSLALGIEHVGSTAIPELSGKPTVDLLVIVENPMVSETLKEKMEREGFRSLGEYVMPGSHLFVKEGEIDRLCNVHVFPKDHPHVKEMTGLRDYFLAHPETVTEYDALKRNLFEKYPGDYASYRKYKDEWMNALKSQIFGYAEEEKKIFELPPFEFDQSSEGWRKIFARGEAIRAAELIRRYITANHSRITNPAPGEKKAILPVMYFHVGQLLAFSGENRYQEAVTAFQKAFGEGGRGWACWNAYVSATIGFLERDIRKIEDAIHAIEESDAEDKRGGNIEIIRNFLQFLSEGRFNYNEAYSKIAPRT